MSKSIRYALIVGLLIGAALLYLWLSKDDRMVRIGLTLETATGSTIFGDANCQVNVECGMNMRYVLLSMVASGDKLTITMTDEPPLDAPLGDLTGEIVFFDGTNETWMPINGQFYQPSIFDKSDPGFRAGATDFGPENGYRATLRVQATFDP